MRIFVVEYITGGGQGGALKRELLAQAELMLSALIRDLLQIEGVELLVSRDARLPPLGVDCELFVPEGKQDIWGQWQACIDRCDAVWPVMPEFDGLLQRISELTLARGRSLLGTDPETIAIAASKYRTAACLRRADIPTVATYRSDEVIAYAPGRWVVKPDDGAGCGGLEVFSGHRAMRRALRERTRYANCVAQPYLQGQAASLSLLCAHGGAQLLTYNLQRVIPRQRTLVLTGIQVRRALAGGAACARLAAAVARALPGLWGYVGVDIVMTAAGPTVVEVNPRLSTSYAGIHHVLGVNPAALVLRMLRGTAAPAFPEDGSDHVDLDLELPHVA